ncbi:phosphoesterase [Thermoanaerobacter kivui]|uniref:Phosphoesterase n=1 Tax=Thermoanaerobacter kivui TaxID=2325 RepID=A0A097APR0_THEKI|nr:metallophosphoesterase [Thermoanaerobacter kivui]AIS51803.1 phosphoesterase [Thermoanaerobacter kivui]
MILAVVSDTHGMLTLVRKKMRELKGIDYIIHLGDNASDVIQLSQEFGIPLEYVKGNCDFPTKDELEKIIEIEGKKILLTHGHRYYVKYEYQTILEKGRELGVDAVFFGHTHIPMISRHQDILLLNPGSPSLPREGSKRTIALVTIDKSGIFPRLINLEEVAVMKEA